ncbi:MAG: MFS transporter, partial [Clostridia bacterium]|nr:MFS transporter [Clostridia bacterium]
LVEEGRSMSIGELFRTPLFWILALLMVCSGASELSMAQWASAFTESALGVSKTVGDLAGPCLFAVLMGISRVFYGKKSEQLPMKPYMLLCGVLCAVCYALASLAASPVLGLIGCAVTGISVGVMWPGTISISSGALPRGGTALFALLALSGDLGGSLGPLLVGKVSALMGDNLKTGILAGGIFPLLLVLGLLLLMREGRKEKA